MKADEIKGYFSSNNGDDTIEIGQYIKVLRRRKWSILVCSTLFLMLALVYISQATPIYEASSKIQADPIQPNATAQDQFIMNSMVFLFYETQYEIIQSRKVAETVVDKLNLVDEYKRKIKEERLNDDGESLISQAKDKVKEIILGRSEGEDSTSLGITDTEIRTMLAKGIQAGINVEGGTQSQIINISYQDEDAELAANIVNAIGQSYIEFGLESRLSQIKDTAEWLTEQLEDLRKTLQLSEDRLRDFRAKQNLMDTEQQQRITNTQLQSLNTELVRAQTELSEARELYFQIKQLEEDNGDYRSLTKVLENNTVRDLVREQATLNRKVTELSERYGPKHPKMVAAISDLRSSEENLSREVAKIIESIKKSYKSAEAQESNIRSLIVQTKNEMQSYQGETFELTRLEREVENNRRIYESFLGKLMEADVSGDYDASNIRIIDSATVPLMPVKPRPALIVVIGLFLGGTVGVILALFKEFLGGVFRTPDQVEKELLLPSLGVTPLVKKGRGSIAASQQYINDQRSTFAEAINSIRTGLLFSNIDNPPKKILITSTNASEGKTTLSINLAVALAQLDKTVLIEMDLRKPAIGRELGIASKLGVSDILSGSVNEEVFHSVENSPNLKVLTCGNIPPNPMELISSRKFALLLEHLGEKFKFIVIDSPPTLPVSDSCVLAKFVDATILAVKSEETKISMAKEAISRLSKVNANLTGAVLTQASPQKMSYYGEHYYQDSYYGEEVKS